MKIAIAAATPFEIVGEKLLSEKQNIQFLYTGVGILLSAVSLTQCVFQQQPDLIIQAGVGGCFDRSIRLGEVVAVNKEYMGDTGVWESGKWKDVFDMNLQQRDAAPFENAALMNESIDRWNVLSLPKVTSVTVNEISTSEEGIERMKIKYNAEVESMEGASLHYVCRLFGVPFIQVRGISNYVGERDKKQWKMKEAIENLNEAVGKMIAMF